MSQENQPQQPPGALKRMLRLLAYLLGIGLLLFIVFTILFSLWAIVTTA